MKTYKVVLAPADTEKNNEIVYMAADASIDPYEGYLHALDAAAEDYPDYTVIACNDIDDVEQ